MIQPICNICDSAVSSILISKDGCNIYQCAKCGLAFTYPQPESLDEQYDSVYFDLYRKRHEFRLRRADARLRRIETLHKPGRLLDIGCSLGYFVEAANARGWTGSGVEISPMPPRKLENSVSTCEPACLRTRAIPVERSIVLQCGMCLSMFRIRPRTCSRCGGCWPKDGLVVIGTPNLGHIAFKIKRERWRHLKPREHIFYFRKSSIARLLAKTGFDVVKPRVPAVQLNDVMIIYGVTNGLEIPSN